MAAILDFLNIFLGGEEGEGAEGPQKGLKGPPALHRIKKEGGRRPPEPSYTNKYKSVHKLKHWSHFCKACVEPKKHLSS